MHTPRVRRLLAALLCCLFLLPAVPAHAAGSAGFRCEKTAETQPDGSVRITLEALQTGRVAETDVVLVLDVSGSMEHNTVVPPDALDGAKEYYILHERTIWVDGRERLRREYVPVRNTAPDGETPTWFATLPDEETPTQIDPAATAFYTGAMEALRAAASEFVQAVADNATQYDADHRVAVVEFSASEAKGADALCTHDNNVHTPFYANILSGSGTADGALVSARDQSAALHAIFAGMHGDGATYSDDAMTQAQRILSQSDRQNRIVVLFTDGGPGSYGWIDDLDASAVPTANGAIAAAAQMKAQGVQIFTVGAFNESDLSSEAGEKNTKYLNYVSSNYPDAQSLTSPGERQSDVFCSIGRTDMNLNAAFAAISAVIGVPVHSAHVQDVVSPQFYLTPSQKDALLADYPAARITENDDGTTSVVLADVDFPTVAVRADGTPVDPQDAGIFTMTFSVTPRETFLGGSRVATNTGLCGVFADGMQLASFDVPQVDVPVRPDALRQLLSLRDVTVYAGGRLTAQDLYDDRSADAAAQYADSVTYTVTDENGDPFTAGTLTSPQTFTVTVCAVFGDARYTASDTVRVQVRDNPVTRLELLAFPKKTVYFVGEPLTLDGIRVAAWKLDGSTVTLTADDLTAAEPAVFDTAGRQTVRIAYGSVSQTFTVTVKAVEPVSARVVQTPDAASYIYRRSPDFTGLAVEITYSNGTTQIVRDLSEMDVRPQSDVRVRRGVQTFTVRTHGVSASFTMRVRLVWWQWLVLLLLFGWIWY